MPEPFLLLLHADDNVAVAATALPADCRVSTAASPNATTLRSTAAIPQGHKIAVRAIDIGEPVIKFGQMIGFATQAIGIGDWVHVHNLSAQQVSRNYEMATATPPLPKLAETYSFQGIRRPSGKVATRNYVAVISNVNCSASVSKAVARRFDANAIQPFPHVDGVVAFTHGAGCGMQFGGEHHQILNRVMGGIARHPNIGAYLLIGLGCETGSLGALIDEQRLVQITGATGQPAAERPPVLVMQDQGGTQKTIDAATRLVGELLPRANDVQRVFTPASELVLGTNCGGSDGNSGVTANPALGIAADMVVAAGGTVILGETTEIYGAEQLLTRRARSPEVAQKLIDRIKWWEWYSGVFGATPDNNPSWGNKAGGLTTIYEKSLGAIAKGGASALNEVYLYAEQVTAKGLVVMDTPGFDPVSVTGIVAGGANVLVFTTGRGSCFGCKPTPSIKVATNTPMFERMRDDMDLDAGSILDGRSVADVGQEIFAEILAVASGKRTKSERLGLGDEEFQPWVLGPTL